MLNTIALRFADNFAPECGTIKAHQSVIDDLGYCWYGKLGAKISKKVIESVLKNGLGEVLLIRSGKAERYWITVTEIKNDIPLEKEAIPAYYRNNVQKFGSWLKITNIRAAESDILSRCFVKSSGTPLAEASKGSMSPYFIIIVEGK